MLAGSCLRGFWRALTVFWRGACNVLEGRGILEEVLAVVLEGCGIAAWRGEAFWRRHFGGGACSVLDGCFWRDACSVLEGRGIFGGVFWRGVAFWRVLAVFWRGVAFWRSRLQGACSVLEGCGILEEVLAVVLEGCGTLGRRLQGCDSFGGRLKCFGGAWHFGGHLKCFGGVWRALEVFWRGVAFWRTLAVF